MNENLCLTIKNDQNELKLINRSIRLFLKALKHDNRVISSVNLILEEAITNIIKYAYDDDSRHQIVIELIIRDEFVKIKITDDGKFFNGECYERPEKISSPDKMKIGGLGIHLMHYLSKEVKYERIDNKNRLSIEIETPIQPQP